MTTTNRKKNEIVANLSVNPAKAAAARAVLEQMYAYYEYEAPVLADNLRSAA